LWCTTVSLVAAVIPYAEYLVLMDSAEGSAEEGDALIPSHADIEEVRQDRQIIPHEVMGFIVNFPSLIGDKPKTARAYQVFE
jgi:hypothetical protein